MSSLSEGQERLVRMAEESVPGAGIHALGALARRLAAELTQAREALKTARALLRQAQEEMDFFVEHGHPGLSNSLDECITRALASEEKP